MSTEHINALARHVAAKGPSRATVRDLVQAGHLGQLEARSRYQGTGSQLESRVTLRMFGAMMDAQRKADWSSRSQKSYRQVIRQAARRFPTATS